MLGICLGMQLLFEALGRARGRARGSACCRARSRRWRRRSCRTSAGTGWRSSARRRSPRGWATPRPSTTCTRFVCRAAEDGDVVGRGEYGERFASIVERDNVSGVQFHPEKSSRDGLALLRELRGRGVILYPGHRHPRRQGRAPRRGPLRGPDRLPRRPARRPRSRGSRRARASCTSSTSTAPAPASRARSSTCAGSRARPACRSSTAAGLRSLPAVREALRAGAERVILGTAAFRDVDFLDAVIEAFGPRVLVSVDVRGGHISTAGWTADDADAGRRRDPAPRRPRRVLLRLHRRRPRRHARGPGPRRGPRGRRGRPRALPLLGRDRRRSSTCSALAALRQVNLAGVIVGKALYEGRFTVAEGQAALDAARPVDGYSRSRSARHRR